MNILPLAVFAPLIGFLLLAFSQGRWSERTATIVGIGSIGVAVLVTALTVFDYRSLAEITQDGTKIFIFTYLSWIKVDAFSMDYAFLVDGLSVVMLSVVVGVGFLIHIYAAWYMKGGEGYARFFAYTNLFIASMVMLILSDNLLLLYLGWEGVGLCSYLLIGFYYKSPPNGAAAMKAFIVTRIGDVFLAIGLFLLYTQLGTLSIHEILNIGTKTLPYNSQGVFWASLMILGGAIGKSAQLPLQTWLADAMAGPTPVSALIHAATMVTAGVYLIARLNGLFILSLPVLNFIAVLGTVTLIVAGFSALVQSDIKRVLAYSTMSQLGYMFLALGVQAWDAAIFHVMTHAFFKALLFLAAGSVIVACHHEQNIHKMGGLRHKIPLVYIAFLVGGAALSSLPLITAGFYSKEAILWGAYANGYTLLASLGICGALLTSLYTFRLIFLVFHGSEKTKADPVGGIMHNLPLVILMVLSTGVGALLMPSLQGMFPDVAINEEGSKLTVEMLSALFAIAGVLLACGLYLGRRKIVAGIADSPIGKFLSNFWYYGWGFDTLYNIVIVTPYKAIARLVKNDPISQLIDMSRMVAYLFGKGLSLTENGSVRWYATSITLGAIIVLAVLVFA